MMSELDDAMENFMQKRIAGAFLGAFLLSVACAAPRTAELEAGALVRDKASSGSWYYRPCEYEAWMLQRMRAEADRGILHFGYPGKFLTLKEEPKAVWSETPVAGMDPIPGDPSVPPHWQERPLVTMPLSFADGRYDVGHEDIGYVYVHTRCGRPPRLFVGESLAELANTATNGFEQSTEMTEVGSGCWRSVIPLALRYFRFERPIERGEVVFRSQVDWREPAGSFACGDTRKEKMWRTGVETLRCCTRTFLVDGIKRDRLPWAADLAVEVLAEAYSFGDPEPIKRTLAALGSGEPKKVGNVNGVASFSMWWVVAHDLLQRYFAEGEYLKLHYPRIRERMEELATHEDARGFFTRNLGWNFMDWTGRDGGQLKSEIALQVIYHAALRAGERLANRVGDGASAVRWAAKADALKAKILAAGMDRTRHSRILAVALDLVDGELARKYAAEIAADDLPPTVTPYMSTFEVMALVKGGETEAALRKFESVWGAMTDFGVDTYWEGWNANETAVERYVFYSRPFGKSLCHAWASGPTFLIPGCFLGIEPDGDGWQKIRVAPRIPNYAPGARVRVLTKAHGLREIKL